MIMRTLPGPPPAPQGFVDDSFEHITSTEHAMSLLQQFQAILQRETLRHDLESKWVGSDCLTLCQNGRACASGAL